ncbi:MAG: hypothetical protein ACPGLV_18815 [Bacteroidia bacterium]
MRIHKNKIPKGYRYPIKTNQIELAIEKFDIKGIESIIYSNQKIGNDLISFHFKGYHNKNKLIENGTSFIFINKVKNSDFGQELISQLPAKLEEGFKWLQTMEHQSEESSYTMQNYSFKISISGNNLISDLKRE